MFFEANKSLINSSRVNKLYLALVLIAFSLAIFYGFSSSTSKEPLTSEVIAKHMQAFINSKLEKKINIHEMDELKDRTELPILLNYFKYKTMIEIGVQQGGFAMTLLSQWPEFKHYYGIDPWEQQKNYKDGNNLDTDKQSKLYQQTLKLLTEEYGKTRITLIRNYSTQALTKFKNESIDFIYVDARHDYCGSSEDINNYYPVLRCGGMMAGHDFQFDSRSLKQDWDLCGNGSRIEGSVKKAVMEFAQQKGIKPIYQTKEVLSPSWYFFKIC
jgi:predicted O-methyltransferase YrrM